MAWFVLLIIIALPLLEIAVFVEVVERTGAIPAVAAAVVAGIAGLALWRQQGLRTLVRGRDALARGEVPVAEVFDGLCLLVAGAMLVLPGFVTDFLALPLLLPPVRRALAAGMVRRTVVVAPGGPRPADAGPPRREVIDVDYRDITDPDEPPRR